MGSYNGLLRMAELKDSPLADIFAELQRRDGIAMAAAGGTAGSSAAGAVDNRLPLTARDVAAQLGIDAHEVYRMARPGIEEIACCRKGTKVWFYQEQVDEYRATVTKPMKKAASFPKRPLRAVA